MKKYINFEAYIHRSQSMILLSDILFRQRQRKDNLNWSQKFNLLDMNKNILLLLVVYFIGLYSLKAQTYNVKDFKNKPLWIEMMQDPNANFFTTQTAFDTYWKDRIRKPSDGWKVFKRWEAFMNTRVSTDGIKPAPGYVLHQYQQMMAGGILSSSSGTWTNMGPISSPTNTSGQPNGIGRVNEVAFDPHNANTIWVGAPAGGLWKSSDGGSSWAIKTDNMPTLGVSCILIDTNNTNIMYIGTGDRDAGDAPGMGVFKSIDGGNTWAVSNTGMGNRLVSKIVMKASNHQVLLAATRGGIYKSTNSGQTWIKKTSGNRNFKDICFQPYSNTVLYATSTYPSVAFYRSMDGGESWSQIATGITSVGNRMVIGVSPANYNVVYLVTGGSSGLVAVYKSINGGVSFATMATSPNILGRNSSGSDNASQSWYDLAIAVSSSNINVLYVGGINVWKSTNGGTSWSLNTHWVGSGAPAVHADHHVLKYSPSNVLFDGNDGGLYKTSDGGANWTDISSGLAISQVYKIGQSASNANMLEAGLQDNGTILSNGTNWTTIIGGDGMECAIDPGDVNYKYGALYYGDIRRSVNGSYFNTIADNGTNGINESGGWVTPYCLQEGNPSTMFVGYKNIWRSTNIKTASVSSVSWAKISTFGNSNNIKVVESSPADNALLFVSRGSSLFRTDNANATAPSWVSISSPGGTITDIEADPDNTNIVYATAGNGVYKSTNKGASWVSITGNLPAVSMNCLVIDTTSNGGLYVGSDVGVFYREASMSNWINFSSGMPAAAEVVELEIYYSANASQSKLRAATFGRGVWSSDLYSNPNSLPTADFYAANTHTCAGGIIDFIDASAPNPTAWQWSVSPSTVSFVNGTNAATQNPHIKFNAVGNYTITLIVTNANGSDTIIKSNYISVTAPYTVPSVENFQSFIVDNNGGAGTWNHNWTFNNTGGFIWRANKGYTPSANTGPLYDHTLGTNAGVYLYTEASNPSQAGDVANLISPCISLPASGNINLSFWYFMYGSSITGLHVDIFSNGAWINDLFTLTGQQQNSQNSSWQKANVSLASYLGNTVKFRFRVIRGADYKGDVAIDDVKIKSIFNAPVADFSASQTSICAAGALPFADLSTNVPNSWQWSVSPSTVSFVGNTTASSQNPIIKFLSTGAYTVTLIASNSYGSDTMVRTNYITVVPAVNIPNTETFETFTVGTPGLYTDGWSTNSIGNFPWYVNSGNTPSNNTGPSVDHTFGTTAGKYLYAEASGGSYGNVAVLTSPCYNLVNASAPRVSFWYYRYGAYVSALRVDVLYNGQWINNVKILNGAHQTNSSSAWLKATVNLDAYVGSSIKLRFRVIHPGDYRSDVAIDDVKLYEMVTIANDDPCGAISLAVGSTCTYSTETNVNATYTQGVPVPNCGGTIIEDVWFKSVVPSSGSIIIDAAPIAGSFADGAMAVYKGSCSSLILVGCNDDYQGSGTMPHIELQNQTPGDTLFIRFWQYGGGTGQFQLCVSEPPHFNLTPQNIALTYNGGSTTVNVDASANVSWSVASNVSWLTVNPTSGIGAGTLTLNYSTNSTAARTAIITGLANGLPTKRVIVSQKGYVSAAFDFSNQMLCEGNSVTFTNNSVNANSYQWFVDGNQVATSTNYTHTFTQAGNYTVKLKSIGTNSADSTSSTVFVSSAPSVNAGSDISLCEGGDAVFNPGNNMGTVGCTTNCSLPSYCSSASINDNQEYIANVAIAGVSHASVNNGPGYEDNTGTVLVPLIRDSNYVLTITAHAVVNWLEYVDAFIDWNRNGLFDEPSISMGSATFNGNHDFIAYVSVPSNAALGKTKMRIIQKYNAPILGGCENNYGYGETEDYSIEIVAVDTLPHSWSGPASFFSTQVNPVITNIALSQSGTYTLSVNNAYGCISTDNKEIQVNAKPVINFASLADVCVGGNSLTLNQASPAGGTYSGSGVVNGVFSPSVAGVGTHIITYTLTNATGCTSVATNTITVHSSPTVSFTGLPSTMCISDANVVISGSPAGGVFSGNGIVMQNQFNPSLAGVGLQRVKYTYTDVNSCTDSAINTLTVYALPTVYAGNDTIINYGNSANLHGSAQGLVSTATYQWLPASKVVSPTNATTATIALFTSTQYTFIVNDVTTNCSDSDHVFVGITGGPLGLTVSTSDDSICVGDTVQLTALGSGGVASLNYAWRSNPSGFIASGATPTFSPTQNTWFIANVTDGNSIVTDSVYVVVNNLPAVSFAMPNQVCENSDTVFMSSIQPTGGVFSGTAVIGNAFVPTQAGVGNFPVSYTYTNANGCTNSKTLSINVTALPSISFTNLPMLCNSSPILTLNIAAPYGGIYSGNGVVGGNQFDPSIAGLGTHYVKYSYTDQNFCSNIDSTTVVVVGVPIANAGADQQVNAGTSATLQGSASGGLGTYSYQWTPANMISGLSTILNPTTVSLNASVIYQLKVIDQSTLCADSDQVIITTLGGNLSAMMLVNQNPICKGDSTVVTAIGSGGTGNYTYSWSSSPAYFSSSLRSPKVAPTATTAFIVKVIDGNDTASAGNFVIVDEIPTSNLPSDVKLCDNATVDIDAGGGFASYQWSNGFDGQIITIQGNTLPYAYTNYYLHIVNANGCSVDDSTRIEVLASPKNILGNDTSICLQSTLILDAGSMLSYLWSTGDTAQTILVDGNLGQGQYNYWVETVNQDNCTGSDTIEVSIVYCNSIVKIDNDYQVHVYPVPFHDKVNVEIEGTHDDDINILIFDNQGKLVYQSAMEFRGMKTVKTLDLRFLSKGMYNLHLQGKQLYQVEKLIVQ